MKKIPHRIYLNEDQMPKQWYNLRADMKELPDPMLNPQTLKPATEEDLYPVFCKELAHQELDSQTRYVDIPEEIQEFYKMYRPSPLIRAYELEKALDNDKIIEIWEVNLLEEGTDTNAGKFKAKYFQGYLTELEITSNAEEFTEVSLTFGINGDGADGYATVSDEQQEIANYVFADTQKTEA